jgi:ketosteroid isomerase-like protein
MRSLLFLVLLASAGTSAACAQESSDSDTATKIYALENVWNRAAEVKDLKALDAILDAAFVYVDPQGRLFTKAEVLAGVNASPRLQLSPEWLVLHLHGGTAVVTGIYRKKGMDHGKPFVRRDRFVDTWRQKNGAWVAIASLAVAMEP